jgi:hypothetical protein
MPAVLQAADIRQDIRTSNGEEAMTKPKPAPKRPGWYWVRYPRQREWGNDPIWFDGDMSVREFKRVYDVVDWRGPLRPPARGKKGRKA